MLRFTISEARQRLTSLPEQLATEKAVCITRSGRPVMALVDWEYYQHMVNTLKPQSERLAELLEQKANVVEQIKEIPCPGCQGKLNGLHCDLHYNEQCTGAACGVYDCCCKCLKLWPELK